MNPINQYLSSMIFSEQQISLIIFIPLVLSLILWRLHHQLFMVYLLTSMYSFIIAEIICGVWFGDPTKTSTDSFMMGFIISQLYSAGLAIFMRDDVKAVSKFKEQQTSF